MARRRRHPHQHPERRHSGDRRSIKAALEGAASLGPTVTVSIVKTGGKSAEFTITFGGALVGPGYQLVATITDTAEVAALASHIQIGKTDFEPLISTTRGWPGVFGFVQERLAMATSTPCPPPWRLSQAGRIFQARHRHRVTVRAAPRQAARRARHRSARAGLCGSHLFLVFTDLGVYFASNRTINKTDPLNYVRVSDVGIVANCQPIWPRTRSITSARGPDDELRAATSGEPGLFRDRDELRRGAEHIFATHLVEGVIRFKPQRAASKADAAKLWMLRNDGRWSRPA